MLSFLGEVFSSLVVEKVKLLMLLSWLMVIVVLVFRVLSGKMCSGLV